MLNKVCLSLLVLFTPVALSEVRSYPLNELERFGEVLNIEGGSIPRYALQSHQLWANIAFVLDTPFSGGGLNHCELSQQQLFALKEAAILPYNEFKANLINLAIVNYYLRHIHSLVGKDLSETARIVFHVHRGSSGARYISSVFLPFLEKQRELFELVDLSYRETEEPGTLSLNVFSQRHNTVLEFRNGLEFLDGLEDADVVVSISLVAGLGRSLQASDIIIPDTFTPLRLDGLQLAVNSTYSVYNHLNEVYHAVIAEIDPNFFAFVREHFSSKNLAKDETLDFHSLQEVSSPKHSTVIQSDGLFNPIKLGPEFHLAF